MTGSSIIGSFWGAFVVNAYSEIMARIIKTPASMFYVY
ncbi:threonine/serine exporter family protein [Clostridium botulinum]|nr:threonine/serine exporter family protein [Clostridium botulinum]